MKRFNNVFKIFSYIVFIQFISTNLVSAQLFEGYTLFSPYYTNENKTYLLNDQQETIHLWFPQFGPASMPYLLPDSSIIYPYRVENPSMVGGGQGGGIQRINWDGSIVWNFTFSNEIYQHHHDIEPLPNGNILIIVWERKTIEEAFSMGRQSIENPLNEMWSEAILELNPTNGNIVWEWHLWDHLIQNVNLDLPNYGSIADHPELININFGTVGNTHGTANADWMHVNSIDYIDEHDQIIFSSREFHEIYIIDHSTTTEEAATHVGGNSGMGGDILYRWGNPLVYERGDSLDQKLFGPHCVTSIPLEFPGGGNIMIFNNGFGRQGEDFSSVDVITPPTNSNGTYSIYNSEPFPPLDLSWYFNNNQNYFCYRQSGAYRLPNGNTLITYSDSLTIAEVTLGGEIVWEFVLDDEAQMIPRAIKYGLNYLTQDSVVIMEINYSVGWNLVGLPIDVENSFYEAVFPESVDGTLYSFENQLYQLDSVLTLGTGYWLLFNNNGSNFINGNLADDLTININEGWNLKSGFAENINVELIFNLNEIIIPGTIYGFNGEYFQPEFLEPGKGYWVKSVENGEMILSY